MESRFPNDKVAKTRHALLEMRHRKKVTLRELQSLIGLLNFAFSIIRTGRAFLRRLIDQTCGKRCPTHKITLNGEARLDKNAWLQFITDFNGKSVFLPANWTSSDTISFFTDASGTLGYAAVFGHVWFAYRWSD